MGDETVPFFGGEVRVKRGEYSANIIFECADCTFGGVAAVCIWKDKLEVDAALAEGFLHGTGALVVEDVESGVLTMLLEVFMARLQASAISRACRFLRSWSWTELVS